MNAIINMYVALHDVVKSSEQYEQQYSELIQSSTKIPGYQNALLTLQALQATSFHPNNPDSPLNCSSKDPVAPASPIATASSSSLPSQGLDNANPILNNEVMECMEALDALVGLRLAIACTHARKINPSLIQNR